MRFAALILTLSLSVAVAPVAAQPNTDPCRPNHRTCWLAHIEHQRNVKAWWAEVVRQQRFRRDMARLARHLAANPPYRSGQCGGSLPPCYVMMRESRGNIHAQNPRSTASGKWQFLDGTWARHRGYAKARHAPEWVQDEKARQLWNNGRGCSHWSAC